MLLENKKILITGASSGLGKFLSKSLSGCVSVTRENNYYPNVEYDLIIHCAYNTKEKIDKYKILQDNIFFTKNLCKLKTKKFVYISTIDVYKEEKNEYNIVKSLAESIIRKECKDYLILRCSAMIGRDMRKNNLLKIIEDNNPILSLTKDSTFNFIRHEQILQIIVDSFNKNISGTYDVISNNNVTLEQISKFFEKNCQYGSYKYITSEIDNTKLKLDFDYMDVDSLTNIIHFTRQINE